MKIAIIDDVSTDRINTKSLILEFCEHKNIVIEVSEFQSGETFIEDFVPFKYDAVFCDIFMKNMTGIDTAKHIRNTDNKCSIIFTTITNSFAQESYEVKALDYITKPISKDKIFNILNQITDIVKNKNLFISVTLKGFKSLKINVSFSDIMYINILSKTVYIHTENETFEITENFSYCKNILLADDNFSICNKYIIINFEYVKGISQSDFILSNGEFVPIKKRNALDIKRKYMSYRLKDLTK